MRLAVKQDSSLIQHLLASQENFRAMASLNKVSDILRLIDKGSRSSAPALACSSALQVPGMSQCPGTQITVTLKSSEKRLR